MSKNIITNVGKNKYSLHRAIAGGQVEEVDKMLQEDNVELNWRDNKGHTPLRVSVIKSSWDITKKLLHHPNIKVPGDFLTYAVKENVPTDIVAELVTRSDQVKAFNKSDTLIDVVKQLHWNYSYSKEEVNEINNIKLLVQAGGDIYNLELKYYGMKEMAVLKNKFRETHELYQAWEEYEKYENVKSKREVVLHLIQEMNNQELTDVFEVARQKIADSIDLIKYVDQYSRLPDDFNEKKLSELQWLVERGTLISTMRIESRQDYEQYKKGYKHPLEGRYATENEFEKDMQELEDLYNPYTGYPKEDNQRVQYLKKELKYAENKISSINNLIETLMQNKNISVDAQNLPDQARALGQEVLFPAAGPSGVPNSLASSSRTKSPERNRVI